MPKLRYRGSRISPAHKPRPESNRDNKCAYLLSPIQISYSPYSEKSRPSRSETALAIPVAHRLCVRSRPTVISITSVLLRAEFKGHIQNQSARVCSFFVYFRGSNCFLVMIQREPLNRMARRLYESKVEWPIFMLRSRRQDELAFSQYRAGGRPRDWRQRLYCDGRTLR